MPKLLGVILFILVLKFALHAMSTLYIVATPIGNLDDISARAIATLSAVDFVIAEDTRQTKKLLSHYGIEKPVIALHAHTISSDIKHIAQRLEHESAALVTDAGTPAIADPGGLLVEYVAEHFPDVRVIPIPGASAITCALSIAGMKGNQFLFMGYVPHKKGRNSFFTEIESCPYTVICFETPHRIGKTLTAIAGFQQKDRKIVIERELTKMFETVYRTTVEHIETCMKEKDYRGEFVILIEGSSNKNLSNI